MRPSGGYITVSGGCGDRKYESNTTASCACHVAYNLLTGFAPSGIYQQVGIGIEVVLAGGVLYLLWTRRRRGEEAVVEVPEQPAVR